MNLLRVRNLPRESPVGIPQAFLADHLPFFTMLDDTQAILQNLLACNFQRKLKEDSQLNQQILMPNGYVLATG